ncbi:hypothetical protein IWW36_000252 [Coemansia brasiliensis]|uniref:Ligatin n=1 Tax=Coemansia brasiliensis TaxID=2650707 RepID=A0A9W8M1E6_9FUNG|nr:hypothetical protein IWW36_000252 [Coemansia brasiliensis]
MFKKPYQTKTQSALRSSACRHLIQESKEKFPQAWCSKEENSADTESPVPSKLQAAKFISHVGDKGEIFLNESGEPLWFRTEPPGAKTQLLVPTVYTQWKFPNMLPILWTWQPVVEKLIGGADLMIPGLIVPKSGLPELKQGSLVAVCCPGSKAAQAIGVLILDTRDIHKVAGAKGKAVLIVHTYKDCLWDAGNKQELPEISVETPASEETNDMQQDEEAAAENPETLTAAPKENSETAATVPNDKPDISPSEMDDLLLMALKQVMATTLDQKHASGLLPISASLLYSTYMIPNAPYGFELDIKKSNYKKLVKFLKAVEKQGLLKLKDIRGELHIKSLNWQHASMANYQPYTVKSKPATKESGSSQQAKPKAKAQSIQITELLKPTPALKPLFEDVKADQTYYTRQQARSVLESYIQAHDLVDQQNRRFIKLDHILCDGLLAKDEYSKLNTFPRDKLQARLQEKMTLYTQLELPNTTPTIKLGYPSKIDIVCEKKMGNKVVTRAAGLEVYGIDPANMAKELRTMCASSTTLDPVPGKKNAMSVLVQGHQVKAVTKLLEKHGLSADMLKVTDRSGKSKK